MSDAGNEDLGGFPRAPSGPGSFRGTGGFDADYDADYDPYADYDPDYDPEDEDDRFGEDDGLGARVRPYAITGGRTRPVGGDLPVESLVLRTARGTALLHELTLERRHIVELCERPLSVAEISAHVGVHLGVTQVLLGDLTAEGLVRVHSSKLADERPDIVLLERVLHGLKAL
ncbi:MAG: DUF742 domain-containing protein [Acidimicrobiales bacterium]